MSIRRGQVFSTDLILSAFIFVVILNVSYLMWTETHEQQNVLTPEKIMQQEASFIASFLVRTPGYPDDWASGTVEILGLAQPDHVIQDAKLDELDTMTEAQIQDAMGISGTSFLINITNTSRTMHVVGRDLIWGTPPTNADSIAFEERSVIVNATNTFEQGRLEVILWR